MGSGAGFAAVGLMLLIWIAGFFVDGGLGLRTDSPLGLDLQPADDPAGLFLPRVSD
ncbi:hypothetical protein [Serratia marcescens]|uniref:hypothetical protein n=1 Tax=Serratia marcescens TaxID=615 RepID=UPI0013DADBDC|nr:hypothetical protein [Serratia marcescens]